MSPEQRRLMAQYLLLPNMPEQQYEDYGFGPIAPVAPSGQPQGEMRSFDGPMTTGEKVGSAAMTGLDYGSLPAKWVTNEIDQGTRDMAAGANEGDLPRFTAGAVRSFAPIAPVATGIGALGAYGAFAAADNLAPSQANAASMDDARKQLSQMTPAQIRALQRELGIADDGKAGNITIMKLFERDSQREKAASRADAVEVEKARAAAEASAAAESKTKLGLANNQRVDDAKKRLVEELMKARTPATDETLTSRFNKSLGSMAPFIAGAAGGSVARMAMPYVGTSKLLNPIFERGGSKLEAAGKVATKGVDDYVLPALAGAELGGSVGMAETNAVANRGDATNPDYRAWQNYQLALPIDAADERAIADEKLRTTPQIDPAVTNAQANMNDFWGYRFPNMLSGAVGGTFGNFVPPAIGAMAKAVPRGANEFAYEAAQMPGNVARGYKRGFQPTQEDLAAAASPKPPGSPPTPGPTPGGSGSPGPGRAKPYGSEPAAVDEFEALRRSGGQADAPVSGNQPPQPASGSNLPQYSSQQPPGQGSANNTPIAANGQGFVIPNELRDLAVDALKTYTASKKQIAPPKGPGPWVDMWSQPAREVMTEMLRSGGNLVPRKGITAKQLSEGIGKKMGDGAKMPSEAESRSRLGKLRDRIGTNPTPERFEEYKRSTPIDANVFGLPLAIAAGAGGAASQIPDEEQRRRMALMLLGY